jgi:hypothetical protein
MFNKNAVVSNQESRDSSQDIVFICSVVLLLC